MHVWGLKLVMLERNNRQSAKRFLYQAVAVRGNVQDLDELAHFRMTEGNYLHAETLYRRSAYYYIYTIYTIYTLYIYYIYIRRNPLPPGPQTTIHTIYTIYILYIYYTYYIYYIYILYIYAETLYRQVRILLYILYIYSIYCICVLMLLYTCPHTVIPQHLGDAAKPAGTLRARRRAARRSQPHRHDCRNDSVCLCLWTQETGRLWTDSYS